jgi:electron transfer flavoprotein alpha subunit
MRILLIIEHDNSQVRAESLKTLAAAHLIGDEIDALVVGYRCRKVAEQASRFSGVTKVLLADDENYHYHIADNIGSLVSKLAGNYTHVLCSSSVFGMSILPRVAAVLGVAQISNITKIVTADVYIRQIFAGNILIKVKSHDAIKIITVMASAFDPETCIQNAVNIHPITCKAVTNAAVCLGRTHSKSDRPSLKSANIIVAGGRGLRSADNFYKLQKLADKLNASIAATRAVVDAGWASYDKQIGQTGQTVAPELYIALGISGASQHLAGMKESRIIVAINKDPLAPIFQVANYGLVADLKEVLPKFIDLL